MDSRVKPFSFPRLPPGDSKDEDEKQEVRKKIQVQ